MLSAENNHYFNVEHSTSRFWMLEAWKSTHCCALHDLLLGVLINMLIHLSHCLALAGGRPPPIQLSASVEQHVGALQQLFGEVGERLCDLHTGDSLHVGFNWKVDFEYRTTTFFFAPAYFRVGQNNIVICVSMPRRDLMVSIF